MKSVSIIGLGSMGSVLGKELLRGGHRVTVWNRSPDKAEELAAAGAALARSASEAIGTSDVTITCIRSHKDTRKLLEEDPSVLAGKTIVELSTGDSAEATSLMQWLRKKRRIARSG